MKLNLRTTLFASAIALFAAPAAWAQGAPATCPAGTLQTGTIVDPATGDESLLCTPDPAAASPEPVTVDTHGRRDISLPQLEAMMNTFGAVRIATADLAMGSAEREAILGLFGPLWQYSPGVATPGLIFDEDNAGVSLINSGTTGEPLGVRVERVDGTFVFFGYPADDECVIADQPAEPDMWKRICLALAG